MAFEFLKLSAELRNHIYEESLTHDPEKGKWACVALLRTCKQINNEAKGIFASESTFGITAEFEWRHKPSSGFWGEVVLQGNTLFAKPTHTDNILKYLDYFSTNLLKAATIRLSFKYGTEHDDDADRMRAQSYLVLLYAFATFVNSAEKNKKIELHVDNASKLIPRYATCVVPRPFWPLRKIHPRHSIKLVGFDQATLNTLTLTLHGRKPELADDLISPYRSMSNEVTSIQRLWRERAIARIHLGQTPTPPAEPEDKLWHTIGRIRTIVDSLFTSSGVEELKPQGDHVLRAAYVAFDACTKMYRAIVQDGVDPADQKEERKKMLQQCGHILLSSDKAFYAQEFASELAWMPEYAEVARPLLAGQGPN